MNGAPPPPPPPPPPPVDSLTVLNNAADLDFKSSYDLMLRESDDNVFEPYSNIAITSKYYDMYTLPSILNDDKSPIFLSINIQSLNSKHSELCNQILELSRKIFKSMLLLYRKHGIFVNLIFSPSLASKPLYTKIVST